MKHHNPYLAEFQKNPRNSNLYSDIATRKHMVRRFAWAIPNDRAIDTLLRQGPLVEVGAGKGYWAHLVRKAGGDIVAYDAAPHHANDWCGDGAVWTDVHVGGPEMAQRHSDRALLLVWPPYNEPMATDTLLAYGGRTVVYVGESPGGCTGDDDFHELLRGWGNVVSNVDIPRWGGIYDYMTVWRKKR